MNAITKNPINMLVMANRIDGITREMTNTLVRTGRSATLVARDLSCSISTAGHELFAAPEGCPVHVYGSGLLCEAMADLHPDFKQGDAFLHNDPYLGNTHAADHTVLVPVFFEGEHVFTTCAKAHQADTGNAIATTYSPEAVDVYAEGAMIFPCVRVQEHYTDVGDIIRMCQKRIRIPEIWYGDYLAMIAAARVGEARIQDFCRKFGLETVRAFVQDWLDYSERMAVAAIRELPAGRAEAWSTVDPFPGLPDGIPLHAKIAVDPQAARVTVDFRDNPDCTPTGLNQSRATSTTAAVSGILHNLNARPHAKAERVPNNAGAFRRFDVLLRENCVLGIPVHPYSCSMATTTVLERGICMVLVAFAQLADGIGLGESAWGLAPFDGVVSGFDRRRDEFYMFQIFSGTAGGPAGPQSDGWLTLLGPGAAGCLYIDSAEVIEQKYPHGPLRAPRPRRLRRRRPPTRRPRQHLRLRTTRRPHGRLLLPRRHVQPAPGRARRRPPRSAPAPSCEPPAAPPASFPTSSANSDSPPTSRSSASPPAAVATATPIPATPTPSSPTSSKASSPPPAPVRSTASPSPATPPNPKPSRSTPLRPPPSARAKRPGALKKPPRGRDGRARPAKGAIGEVASCSPATPPSPKPSKSTPGPPLPCERANRSGARACSTRCTHGGARSAKALRSS